MVSAISANERWLFRVNTGIYFNIHGMTNTRIKAIFVYNICQKTHEEAVNVDVNQIEML